MIFIHKDLIKNLPLKDMKSQPKHQGCKKAVAKKKTGLVKKVVKSKLVAKACVGMLLITLKVLILMIQATKHLYLTSMFCGLDHQYQNF